MTSRNNTVEIDIQIPDPQLLKTLFQTIEVETKASEIERGKATVLRSDKSLTILVEADDFVATRAITNSMMRLLKTSVDVSNSINTNQK